MQCASSTTSRPVLASSGSAVSANRGLASRSGETSSTSSSSAPSASNTGCQSSTLAELTVAARSPARSGRGDLVAHQRQQRRDDQRRAAAGLAQRRRWPPSRPRTCPSRWPGPAAPAGRRPARPPPRPGPAAVSRPDRPSPRARPPAAAPPPRFCPRRPLCQPPPTEPAGSDGPVRTPHRMQGIETAGQRSATSMRTLPVTRCSTAACAFAASASGKRWTGSPAPGPIRTAPSATAALMSSIAAPFASLGSV